MKVAFKTLGCKLNYSETSSISREFVKKGYEKVSFDDASWVIMEKKILKELNTLENVLVMISKLESTQIKAR